jgi:hypothetical protein
MKDNRTKGANPPRLYSLLTKNHVQSRCYLSLQSQYTKGEGRG